MTLIVEEVRYTSEGLEAKISGQWLLILAFAPLPTEGVEGSDGPGPGPVGVDGSKNAQPGTVER